MAVARLREAEASNQPDSEFMNREGREEREKGREDEVPLDPLSRLLFFEDFVRFVRS
jgi:hypothetical protein